ncbi:MULTISPECIES: putative adhesin [Xanthomonas]|uniref:Putative adhesin Stv domain-containing protein n=1 Tax=Xanthomonas cucurbitae TaxID=56453 RepID=A0ABY7YCB4_9XANT|nr:hypothetical protein [Xanthomonas cucurbitae]WDM67515.1 hypothetical protein K6981_19005 [Xanthomonas cucurbitae]WDM71391.1 hypothetical protein K6978_18970 [Xanthomonas cucurbitae]WDM75632.1 hypothetical protein K6982_00810 [Xanthomonas cucurbitae]WDM79336.1 hypothetical protein K6980_00795 [Xanthomonas cucurbitae]WDM83023.1 hypothetical protein K6979_00800 [Xanthomonas cucurbitae]
MPLIVLWGHGLHESEWGYFQVPPHVEIHFFVRDGVGLTNSPAIFLAKKMVDGGPGSRITQNMLDDAKEMDLDGAEDLFLEVIRYPQIVKNYTLESMVDLPMSKRQERSVEDVCRSRLGECLSPGIGVGTSSVRTGAARSHLQYAVHRHLHRANAADPLVVQWAACRE